jgi:hypothetical protein
MISGVEDEVKSYFRIDPVHLVSWSLSRLSGVIGMNGISSYLSATCVCTDLITFNGVSVMTML